MGVKNDLIYIEGMTKTYGVSGSHNIVALNNISFSLSRGANSILGPNGAGKSTLIKVLLGYIKADSGEAQVLGYDIKSEGRKIKEFIGYMPEHYTIIPGVNAVKQVSLLGKIAGLPAAEAMQRAHETLQYVGLDEARYRKVNEFSTGMLQRLKLAQALVNDPELLILDEPTNGLDPRGRIDMIDLIREISQDHSINLLISSHLLPDIEATCEFATILDRGHFVTQGRIDDLTGQEAGSAENRMMNIQIKGSLNDFLGGLRKQGLTFEVIDKVIQVPYSGESPAQSIIQIAYDTNTQIRSMTPRKAILEDVFIHQIEGAENKQAIGGKN